MIGIALLVCVLAVLGFVLSWITGVVAKEEVEIKTSMLILFLTGVVNVAVGFVTADLNPWVAIACGLAAAIGTLALLIRLVGGVNTRHAIIIAVAFAVLLNAATFVLALIFA